MTVKLVVAIVGPEKTDNLMDIARSAGATGATILANGRGEGCSGKRGAWTGADPAARRVAFPGA